MSFILVVEPDAKSATAIHDALASEGMEVQSVSDPDAALQIAAARAPKLVIVNGDVQQADRLLSSFSRRHGGPGAVALISTSGRRESSLNADELLQKPFTDSDLKQAVERCWEAERRSAASGRPTGGMQFSSAEIFGDVLAELEEDEAITPPQAARWATDSMAAPQTASAGEPEKRQPEAAAPSVDAEVDSMLANTLAGLDLGPTSQPKPARPVVAEPAPAPPTEVRGAPDMAAEPVAEPPAKPSVPATEPPAPAAVVSPIAEAEAAEPDEMVGEEAAVDVLEPVAGQEIEEGDSRSRMVLIGAIAATALIGVLLVVLLNFRGDGDQETLPATVAGVTESASQSVDEPDAMPTSGEAEGETAAAIEMEAAAAQSPAPPVSPPSTALQPAAQKMAPAKATPPPAAVSEAETVEAETAVAEPAAVEIPEPVANGVEAADSQGTTVPAAPAIITETVAEVAADPVAGEEVPTDEVALEAAALETASDNAVPAESAAEPQETGVSQQVETATPPSATAVSAVDEAPVVADPEPAAAVPETPSVQPGDLVTAGPGVVAPKLVSFAKPRYPEMARRMHKQGTVVAAVLVDETGNVIDVKLVQTVMATFDSAVLRAAKRAKFSPATKDGIPVKMWHNIEVRLQADS